MEETRINGKTAAVRMSHDTNEGKLIAICDAATIGVMKTIKQLGIHLDEQTIKDLKSEALLTTLEHVNPDTEGALSYADKCGRTSVLKSIRRNSFRYGRQAISFEVLGSGAETLSDESTADGNILLIEGEKERNSKMESLRKSILKLSEADKALFKLCLQGVRYGEIARRLGCSEGTARKRALDMRKRIRISVEKMQACAA